MSRFLFLFLLVFPKGGFKIADLPITWGYLFLGAWAIYTACNPLSIEKKYCQAMLCLLPFQWLSACLLLINGSTSIEYTIAFLTTFLFLPLLFFVSSPVWNLPIFIDMLKKGILFVSSYGLILFGYQAITGDFFEIPFLTTNFNDYGLLLEKCNLRTLGISKLISTYNNGNIYGLCLLMLLPLYCLNEPSKWKQTLVKLSILLTLSRTVWIGLFIHELLFTLCIQKNSKSFVLKCVLSVLTISFLILYLGLDASFIWDVTLGGRIDQLETFHQISLFSSRAFDGIAEIVYIGILSSFGAMGLLTFLGALVGPIALSASNRSPIHTAIRCGLCNYLLLCGSDGAILLIPVMAIFWLLTSLALSETLAQQISAANTDCLRREQSFFRYNKAGRKDLFHPKSPQSILQEK